MVAIIYVYAATLITSKLVKIKICYN